jgi:hypothetical protein
MPLVEPYSNPALFVFRSRDPKSAAGRSSTNAALRYVRCRRSSEATRERRSVKMDPVSTSPGCV